MNIIKPCVIVQIGEGLGNQMFNYAVARALSLRNDVPLFLDIHSQYRINAFKRQYLLDHFNIHGIVLKKGITYLGNVGHLIWKTGFFSKRTAGLFYLEKSKRIDDDVIRMKIDRPVYLLGYWQNEAYFKDFYAQIKSDFTRKTAVSKYSLELKCRFKEHEAVCVHLRTYHEIQSDFSKKLKYYYDAIELLSNKISHPHFYIFSDTRKVQEFGFHIDAPHTFVNLNFDFGYKGALDDLWLMNQCNHHILSSSSFSWWGAYLRNNSNGFTIVPKGSLMEKDGCFPNDWFTL